MAGDIADVYLRFDGFTGECNDEKHAGEKGWITIKSFRFGFGFEGQDAAPDEDRHQDSHNGRGNGATTGAPNNGSAQGRQGRRRSRGMKSGPLTFDCIQFTKSADVMSSSLMEACANGDEITKVELEACRYGGGQKDYKLPFLRLIFEHVHLKSLKLNLATEGMPTEDIEFEYEKVEMKCMWTDNATGNRLPSQPIGAAYDLQSQEESQDVPNDDGEP